MIKDKIKEQIKEHALKDPLKESCGFVLSNDEVVLCENKSNSPESQFVISPEDFLKNINNGARFVFHSHPNGSEDFSPADKFYQEQYSLPLIVYSIKGDAFNLLMESFDMKKYSSNDINFLKFVKIYFEEKFKIKFDEFLSDKTKALVELSPENIEFDGLSDELICSCMSEAHFKEVEYSTLKNEDVVFFKRLNIIHAMIYFENFFLHKNKNGFALFDKYFLDNRAHAKCYRYAG